MRSKLSRSFAYTLSASVLIAGLLFVFGCGEDSSEITGGDYEGYESELTDVPGDDRCADVGDEACPAATDCMNFTAIQTAFPECAIYCKADVINEGLSCRLLEEYGVCSNGRCVIPGQTVDGDADNAACRPEYAEVPECPEDEDCSSYEHMWQPSPDCRWLCVALPRNSGQDCVVGGYSGVCENAQCIPVENGDAESLPDGDIDDIENESETEVQEGDWDDESEESELDTNEDDSATGDIEGELSETQVDGDISGSGVGGATETITD